MKAFGDVAGSEFLFELGAGDAAFQADIQFRLRRGAGNVPGFGFCFAAQFGGFVSRRMDLERKLFLRIENFYQQREAAIERSGEVAIESLM